MRRIAAILTLTLLHASLSLVAFFFAYRTGMGRFDAGSTPTILEQALDVSVIVLYFPVVWLAQLAPQDRFPGLWGYVPVFINSACWAVALVYAGALVRRVHV